MKIKYKILSIDTAEHTMVVRFYTDKMSEEDLCSHRKHDGSPMLTEDGTVANCRTDVNLAIWQYPAPGKEELEVYIMSHAPIAWFKHKEQISNPEVDTSMSSVLPLVGLEHTVELENT